MRFLIPALLFIACLFPCKMLLAQQTKSNAKWQYQGIVQGGLVTGSTSITFAVQTMQGIQKNNWYTGLGIGYDNYGMPGIPLVLHGQKAFTQKNNKPFVYIQSGIQIPVKTGAWNDKGWMGTGGYDLKTGFIGELGGGYTIALGKKQKTAFIFNAGYSYKFNKATYTELAWPPYLSSLPPQDYDEYRTEQQEYHYRRIMLKAGWMF
jgi:hypothetical protein